MSCFFGKKLKCPVFLLIPSGIPGLKLILSGRFARYFKQNLHRSIPLDLLCPKNSKTVKFDNAALT
jgi:hypothetical protein